MIGIRRIVSVAMVLCAITATTGLLAQTDIINTLSDPADVLTDGQGIVAGAQRFTTDSTARTLESVTVAVRGTVSDTLGVFIYGETSGLPGTQLLSLGTATPAATDVFNDVTLTAGSALVLQANTSYWVVGQYNGVSDWGIATAAGSTGVGTVGDFAYSTGSGWNGPFNGFPYLVEVTALNGDQSSGTPEPGSFALALALSAAVGIKIRSQKRRTK